MNQAVDLESWNSNFNLISLSIGQWNIWLLTLILIILRM